MPLDNLSELRRRVPGGKYALARAIAERARQLQEGSPPLTPVRIANPLSVAIDEIVSGKVSFNISTAAEAEAEAAAKVKPAKTPRTKAAKAPVSTDHLLRIEPEDATPVLDDSEDLETTTDVPPITAEADSGIADDQVAVDEVADETVEAEAADEEITEDEAAADDK